MGADLRLFERYAPLIRALPEHEQCSKEDLLVPDFLLHSAGKLTIYYSPLDSINERARVIFLGITPGWRQMDIAYRVARAALLEGRPATDVCHAARVHSSFAGSMRRNLIAMLDQLDLPALLGITSSAELFGARRELIHTTSAIRYPVFVDGRNYTGHGPSMLRDPLLRSYVDGLLTSELRAIPAAPVVPLGNAVAEVLRHLIAEGIIEERRCLFGFPHPSGANGHRQRDFAANRERLAEQLAELLGAVPSTNGCATANTRRREGS